MALNTARIEHYVVEVLSNYDRLKTARIEHYVVEVLSSISIPVPPTDAEKAWRRSYPGAAKGRQ